GERAYREHRRAPPAHGDGAAARPGVVRRARDGRPGGGGRRRHGARPPGADPRGPGPLAVHPVATVDSRTRPPQTPTVRLRQPPKKGSVMRGIGAPVGLLVALCSVARAAESTTSNSSGDLDTKSKTEGHAHATPEESPKALEAIPTSP